MKRRALLAGLALSPFAALADATHVMASSQTPEEWIVSLDPYLVDPDVEVLWVSAAKQSGKTYTINLMAGRSNNLKSVKGSGPGQPVPIYYIEEGSFPLDITADTINGWLPHGRAREPHRSVVVFTSEPMPDGIRGGVKVMMPDFSGYRNVFHSQ